MTDASLLLQGGLFQALRTHAGVQSSAGDRIYDHVPDDVVFPYVNFASSHLTAEMTDCGHSYEVFQDIHVWSRDTGFPELKNLCADIRDAAATLTLGEGELVLLNHVTTRHLQDPDPTIRHGVITFQAFIYLLGEN